MSRVDLVSLDLSGNRVYGREEAIEELQSTLDRVRRGGGKLNCCECVLVEGDSGSGKTTMLDFFRNANMENASFVVCNFSDTYEEVASLPYRAFFKALNLFCASAIDLNKQICRDAVNHTFDRRERIALRTSIPSLESIINDGCFDNGCDETERASNGARIPLRRHTEHLIRELLRLLTEAFSTPLLIQCDDLQWADPKSLKLLKALMTDRSYSRILVVASYTASEGGNSSAAAAFVEELRTNECVNCRTLSIGVLSLNAVNELIADASEMRPTETLSLAEVVHEKTGGHCYAVINLLRMLQEEALMHYSFETYEWVWDVAKIRAETIYSDNVVDVVIGRINRLQEAPRSLLRVASCFGTQFDADLVAVVMKSPSTSSRILQGDATLARRRRNSYRPNLSLSKGFHNSMEPFTSDLRTLERADLVAYHDPSGRYRFTHDRIQQAAYEMITDLKEREQLHLRIGTLLFELKKSPERSKEWVFFSAIDQLNRGSSGMNTGDKVELARLNLEAGMIAKAKSAFIPAARFFQVGRSLLNHRFRWSQYYRLVLELSNEAAEMEHASGNAIVCQETANEILAKANSFHDKIRAYSVLIKSLGDQGNLKECLQVAFKALAKLGERLPYFESRLSVLFQFTKVSKLMEQPTTAAAAKDVGGTKLAVVEIVTPMTFFSFFWNQQNLPPILICRLVQLSLKYGLKEYLPIAYSGFALLQAGRGETSAALNYSSTALEQLDTAHPSTKATIMYIASKISHWRLPLRQILDPLLTAYAVGMETGNIEVALLCAGTYCSMYVMCGLPLQPVAEDLRGYMELIQEYGQENAYMLLQPVWQHLLNLMGNTNGKELVVLNGEAMNEDRLKTRATKFQNDHVLRTIPEYKLRLSVIFGCHDESEVLISKLEARKGNMKVDFGRAIEIFEFGVTFFALARRKRRRHYLKKARGCLKEIREWVRKGNVNCHDLYLLLEAEDLSFSKETSFAFGKKAYDKAIASASRSGFVHRAAHSNELAAQFCFRNGDDHWGESYIRQAHNCYRRWGAGAKVVQLESLYSFLEVSGALPSSNQLSGSFQGRPRFTRKAAYQHSILHFE